MFSKPLAWRKGSKSQGSGGNCVEAGVAGESVHLRDSKAVEQGTLAISRDEFTRLAAQIEQLRSRLPTDNTP